MTSKTTPKQRSNLTGGITGKGFQPGVSGNPAGRPPTAEFSRIAREMMAEEDPKKRKSKARLLVENAYSKALRGSARHLEILLDRTEGRVKYVAEVTGADGGALRYAHLSDAELESELARMIEKYKATMEPGTEGPKC